MVTPEREFSNKPVRQCALFFGFDSASKPVLALTAMISKVEQCRNVEDFRRLAKRRLPAPVFHYIDGAADDEVTYRRNTESFDTCDLVPNVLAGVSETDMSVEVMGCKLDMPFFCSPTALQRLFHPDAERGVARAAHKFGTMFGVSSLSTVSLAEIGALTQGPKMFQFYYHKDQGLNSSLMANAKAAKFDVLALTVDTIIGGNRERDLETGFTSPPKLTPSSALSFAMHPGWVLNMILGEKFELKELNAFYAGGSSKPVTTGGYFSSVLDQSMDWSDAEKLRSEWGGVFCLKGIMSVADAKKAIDIGADAIMVSNHGGRQLDGSRAPFDHIAEIADAVGDRIEIILDGGVRRGTHVLKALAAGAKACSGGRLYLYALAAAGQAGVEKALSNIHDEIERDMKLMGANNLSEINREMLRYR